MIRELRYTEQNAVKAGLVTEAKACVKQLTSAKTIRRLGPASRAVSRLQVLQVGAPVQ
jgi:hypothetical protein